MSTLWNPQSAIILPDIPTFAPAGLLRKLLAGGKAVTLKYAGDRMWPAVRHGQILRCRDPGTEEIASGDVVIACPGGIPDLLRIQEVEGDILHLAGDADPGPPLRVQRSDVLARAEIPAALPGPRRRRLRRALLDLREASRGPDPRPDPAETVRLKYETQAPFYAGSRFGVEGADWLARFGREVRAGARVLVAGSGTGRECFALAAAGWEVVGVDFSASMVRAARAEGDRRSLPVTFVDGDLRTYDVPSRSLAAALFTFDVYSFLPRRRDRIDLLRRMAAWLEPGGVVFLSARIAEGGYRRLGLFVSFLASLRRGGVPWGASHTRWIAPDGEIHRSFIHVFGERSLAREARRAGYSPGSRSGGHLVLRPRPGEGAAFSGGAGG